MTQLCYLSADVSNEDIMAIFNDIKPYSNRFYKTHSSAGIEVATMVIDLAMLIIAVVSCPLLIEYIKSKKISLSFNNHHIDGFLKKIFKELKNNKKMFDEIVTAYENEYLDETGNIKTVAEFEKRLNELIQEETK